MCLTEYCTNATDLLRQCSNENVGQVQVLKHYLHSTIIITLWDSQIVEVVSGLSCL